MAAAAESCVPSRLRCSSLAHRWLRRRRRRSIRSPPARWARLDHDLAGLYRHPERLLRSGRHQGRSGVCAVVHGDRTAGGGRLHQPDGRQRHRRSDPRHREGCADRDLAHRHAVAALCASRQARDQEHQGAQGQDHPHRRRRRTSPAFSSSACWCRTASSRRVRSWCSRARPRRALSALQSRRGRCRDPDLAAIQFLCGGRGLHQSRPGPSNMPRNCRSPAAQSNRACAAANKAVLRPFHRGLQQERELVLRTATTAPTR